MQSDQLQKLIPLYHPICKTKANCDLLAHIYGQGRKIRRQVRLPEASKFCSWASENKSSVAWWASEISLSGLVSLNKNVSLINNNFQSEAISKLKTARLVNHWVESMD